jgi:heat shock protein HslJ
MRPVGKLLLRDLWIATSNPGLPKLPEIAPVQIADDGNSFTLTAACNAFGGSWRIQPSGQAIRCIESRILSAEI